MGSVEQELWNIFTFYTLHGNPLDPEHIRAQQFVKFAKECHIVGPSAMSGDDKQLVVADVNVVYTAEVKKKRATKGMHKMDFSDFLTALMKLSAKVYPKKRRMGVEHSFNALLTENVLPMAGRRQPQPIDKFVLDEQVNALFRYYKDALEQIFQFYASGANPVAAAGAGAASGGAGGRFRSSDGASELGSSSRSVRSGLTSPARRGLGGATNSMKSALGYKEFLKFASDFELSNSVILSTLELGDIYLSSLHDVAPDSRIRKLSFAEFWEALVRCALIAYSKISDATVIDKIRGLFLYMWRAINKNVPKAFSQRRNVSTYAGDLIAGAMLFNKRFTAQWQRDGFRDYLNPETAKEESGRDVLRRIMGRAAEAEEGEGTRALLDASASDLMAGSPSHAGAPSSGASPGGYGGMGGSGSGGKGPEAPYRGMAGSGSGAGAGAGADGLSASVASVGGAGAGAGAGAGMGGSGFGSAGASASPAGGAGAGGRTGVSVPGGPVDGALPAPPPSGAGERRPWGGMMAARGGM